MLWKALYIKLIVSFIKFLLLSFTGKKAINITRTQQTKNINFHTSLWARPRVEALVMGNNLGG